MLRIRACKTLEYKRPKATRVLDQRNTKHTDTGPRVAILHTEYPHNHVERRQYDVIIAVYKNACGRLRQYR